MGMCPGMVAQFVAFGRDFFLLVRDIFFGTRGENSKH